MKHKIDYEIGKKYYIDEKEHFKHKVTLKHFWKETMIFALVEDIDGCRWETMLTRLTEIT